MGPSRSQGSANLTTFEHTIVEEPLNEVLAHAFMAKNGRVLAAKFKRNLREVFCSVPQHVLSDIATTCVSQVVPGSVQKYSEKSMLSA